MTKLLNVIAAAAILFVIGCGKISGERDELDDLALEFAFKCLSQECLQFNEAWLRRQRRYGNYSGTYDMPQRADFSVESCQVSEWQGVRRYAYNIKYRLSGANNHYAKILRGAGAGGAAYLRFTIEVDGQGNSRLADEPFFGDYLGRKNFDALIREYMARELD